jgi:hypothetical protein
MSDRGTEFMSFGAVSDDLRRALIRDQADRDANASRLVRYRDENGEGWADIIDLLTMYPDARRRVVRVLGEIDAG